VEFKKKGKREEFKKNNVSAHTTHEFLLLLKKKLEQILC
jgi:hypothetical protein